MTMMPTPHATAGTWSHTSRGQRQARSAPTATKRMNARWTTITTPASASNTIPTSDSTHGQTGERRATLKGMRLWRRRLAMHAAGTAGVFAYAWWATGRRPFTATATLAVVGAGLAALAIGQSRRPQNEARPALAGVVGWLV